MASRAPFALRGASEPVQHDEEAPLLLEYDREMQRNRMMVDGMWIDVVDAASELAAETLMTRTNGATMTAFPPGSGNYKLDDDK